MKSRREILKWFGVGVGTVAAGSVVATGEPESKSNPKESLCREVNDFVAYKIPGHSVTCFPLRVKIFDATQDGFDAAGFPDNVEHLRGLAPSLRNAAKVIYGEAEIEGVRYDCLKWCNNNTPEAICEEMEYLRLAFRRTLRDIYEGKVNASA